MGMRMINRTYSRHTEQKTGRLLPLIALFLAAAACLAGAESRADIYRYVDESGVECFTDTPAKKGATRIIKEQKNARLKAPDCKTGRSSRLAVATKSGPAHTAQQGSGALTAFVLPVQGTVTSQVGMRHDPIDGLLRHHNGVDIAVREGTPVRPVASGIVSYSGFRPGYGNMVIISHDDGMVTVYAHNSVRLVQEGERVEAGSTIALSGSTGRSTGPHLHFEAWKDGVNMTTAFMSGIHGNGVASSGLYRREETIRRILQADGSLLFTNLP